MEVARAKARWVAAAAPEAGAPGVGITETPWAAEAAAAEAAEIIMVPAASALNQPHAEEAVA